MQQGVAAPLVANGKTVTIARDQSGIGGSIAREYVGLPVENAPADFYWLEAGTLQQRDGLCGFQRQSFCNGIAVAPCGEIGFLSACIEYAERIHRHQPAEDTGEEDGREQQSEQMMPVQPEFAIGRMAAGFVATAETPTPDADDRAADCRDGAEGRQHDDDPAPSRIDGAV